jgi:hypothetical protein
MRVALSAALLCAVLACPAVEAAFTNVVDTPTLLQGSFLADGQDAAEILEIMAFAPLFPTGGGFLSAERQFQRVTRYAAVFTAPATSPDLASLNVILSPEAQQFADASGVFNNNPSQTPVYWRYFALRDSGDGGGEFTGKFCFSTDEANCAASAVPEPLSAWLVLAGLGGLVGFGLLRRRRNCS